MIPTAQRWSVLGGAPVLLEEEHSLPLVDFAVAFRSGSLFDPVGKEGLTRLTGRMIRMGTRRLIANQLEQEIARLGARLSIETSSGSLRFHGTVIQRNLEPFLELLGRTIREPAFRDKDLGYAKRETIADLIASRDNDRSLASRHFRRTVFGDHPYARPIVGTPRSVRSIRRNDLLEYHQSHLTRGNVVFAAAGATSAAELLGLVEKHFDWLPDRRVLRMKVPAPSIKSGRHLVLVDKPGRTQTQMYIGGLGVRYRDPLLYPLLVANTAYGGTFTSRLMQEIRVKRGWSYGAYSRLGQNQQRDTWYMWSHPSSGDVAACAQLELDLLDEFLERGISAAGIRFAKSYLAKSHCFEVDTAAKRLEAQVDLELQHLPIDLYTEHIKKVRQVKPREANEAVRRRLSSKNLTIALLATAKDVRDSLEKLPKLASVTVVPFDRE